MPGSPKKQRPTSVNMTERGSVKVYFQDGSFKSCKCTKDTTIEELWEIMSEKLSFSVKTAINFFIWGCERDLELLLYSDTRMEELKTAWPLHMREWSNSAKKQHKKLSNDFRLVYRPTAIVPIKVERSVRDPEAVHLFFLEAVNNVVKSNYPCDVQTAVELGGLQAQAVLGDRNQALHKRGYLGREVSRFVPKHLFASKKTEEWEELIFAKHESCRGQEKMITKMLYLQLVRQWTYYGSVFHTATFTPSSQTFYSQEFSGGIALGVNWFGLHIIDPVLMKIISVEFKNIVKLSSTNLLFGFTERQLDKTQPPKEWIFRTKAGHLINDLIHDWFAEIKATDNWVELTRKQQKSQVYSPQIGGTPGPSRAYPGAATGHQADNRFGMDTVEAALLQIETGVPYPQQPGANVHHHRQTNHHREDDTPPPYNPEYRGSHGRV
eukprot:TRINITY_DN12774_c0_g1_i1.p1 TRINITY_DN12774_c0_g1~~TRINITY_DN12774_c0_g1_i1.p1  ORF type:complete len:437 (+),score=130.88 TRINITY_DN12774_c0_g1_i1:177-1487(+)